MQSLHFQWRNPLLPAPDSGELERFVRRAADIAGLPTDFSWDCQIEFTDDDLMTRRNMELLGHEGTTDVITFCYFDDDPWLLEGECAIDLVVNPDAALREGCRMRRKGYSQETAVYVIHGLLHSAGFDDIDPADRKKMRQQEHRVVNRLLKEGFVFEKIFPPANA